MCHLHPLKYRLCMEWENLMLLFTAMCAFTAHIAPIQFWSQKIGPLCRKADFKWGDLVTFTASLTGPLASSAGPLASATGP